MLGDTELGGGGNEPKNKNEKEERTHGHEKQCGDFQGYGRTGKVEEGIGRISGNGGFTWVVNTQYSVQMICNRIVHLKTV